MARGDKKGGIWNARQSSRAIFAFYGPRPPLGRLTKEMGLTLRSSDRPGAETRNPAARMKCAGGLSISRFLRSQLRRIGLGHPPGRDPLRTIDKKNRYAGER